MLEEVGRPYTRELVDIRLPERQDSAEFLACSPLGKVPALEDGPVRISDSATICMYVADRYSSGSLAPTLDSPRRGEYLYWMNYTPGVIEPAMSEKLQQQEPNRFSNGWSDFETMLGALSDGVGAGPWVLGEEFTAADVMLGSSVLFLRAFGLLPEDSPLNSYADRCAERPGYQVAAGLDED